jgi:hypothetical protein
MVAQWMQEVARELRGCTTMHGESRYKTAKCPLGTSACDALQLS